MKGLVSLRTHYFVGYSGKQFACWGFVESQSGIADAIPLVLERTDYFWASLKTPIQTEKNMV